ncbi:MAG TPA: hypothetical protein VKN99_09750 [Polyangia bacterium]|nr:hypothetical protein [Polyangia bacterium]
MRSFGFLCGACVVLALGASALADELATPAPAAPAHGREVRGKLVGVILDTGQALLWDDVAGKYALREVGEEFQGQRIVALEKERVQLEHATLELAAAPMVVKRAAKKLPALIVTAPTEKEARVPISEPTFVAPAAPAASAKTDPAVHEIGRQQLESELRDFAALAQDLVLQPAPGGGWKLVRLHDGSLLRKLGLRPGDVVRRVADLPINTFDDAAAAYARIRTSDHVSVELEREGRPLTLVVKIQG